MSAIFFTDSGANDVPVTVGAILDGEEKDMINIERPRQLEHNLSFLNFFPILDKRKSIGEKSDKAARCIVLI